MKLHIRHVDIKDVQFTEGSSCIKHNRLFINQADLDRFILEDERILSCQIELAKPGQSVRIIPVKDVIEPRAKIDGQLFSGILDHMDELGSGTTIALKGCAIVTTGAIVGFQEGIIDMSGPLVDYTPFASLQNIVLVIEKKPHLSAHEHEQMIRETGIRVAEHIGRLGFTVMGEEKELEWPDLVSRSRRYPDLPKVGYLCLCMAQGLLHDTYFYGKKVQHIVPTMVSPLEVFDGAIVSGNCVSPGSKTTTWHHQNNAVMNECLNRHSDSLNFMAMAISPLMTTLEEKYRNTLLAAKLMISLGVDGVVISQEGFGNPTTDLMMICRELEKNGIKTVLISNEDAGVDGLSEPLPDGTPEADAIISTGNSNATIELPVMERVIGDLKAVERITGGFVGSIQPDGRLIIEIHGIMGSHNLQGYNKLQARTV